MSPETVIELHNPHNNLNQYANDLVKIVFLCLIFSLNMEIMPIYNRPTHIIYYFVLEDI